MFQTAAAIPTLTATPRALPAIPRPLADASPVERPSGLYPAWKISMVSVGEGCSPGGQPCRAQRKVQAIIRRSGRGAMTRTSTRGIPILDGVETAVAAARVAVRSAARFAFHRGLAQTPPGGFSLCSSALVAPGSYRQARFSHIAALCPNLRRGGIHLCLDRPTDGVTHTAGGLFRLGDTCSKRRLE